MSVEWYRKTRRAKRAFQPRRPPAPHRSLGDTAELAPLFKISPHFWVRLQADRDLHEALERQARAS